MRNSGSTQSHDLAKQLRSGSRRALAKAITLVESTRSDHRRIAQELMCILAADAGSSQRIGISGAPGVGKSTFIEAFGRQVLDDGHRLAVLAIDPTSTLSGGSILGDKTRMESLSRDERAFIRPSPAGSILGGVARHTRDCINLCEAAGFDLILVETVGVGQSESAVAAMTDMFIVLIAPGAGDDLQGIKRGIMELVDLLLVNKADGEQRSAANHTVADYRKALSLLRGHNREQPAAVHLCSALTGEGLPEVWQHIQNFMSAQIETGAYQARRSVQAQNALWAEVTETLLERIRRDSRLKSAINEIEHDVGRGVLPPGVAAVQLLNNYFNLQGSSDEEAGI